MRDQLTSQKSTPAHSFRSIVFFLLAFVGCCMVVSILMITIHISHRRRHGIWFRICRRYPSLSWLFAPEDSLPKDMISGKQLEKLFPQQDYCGPDESCRICLEDVRQQQKTRTLGCGHVFHTQCIDIWVTKYRSRCAVCTVSIGIGLEQTDGIILGEIQGNQRIIEYMQMGSGEAVENRLGNAGEGIDTDAAEPEPASEITPGHEIEPSIMMKSTRKDHHGTSSDTEAPTGHQL